MGGSDGPEDEGPGVKVKASIGRAKSRSEGSVAAEVNRLFNNIHTDKGC